MNLYYTSFWVTRWMFLGRVLEACGLRNLYTCDPQTPFDRFSLASQSFLLYIKSAVLASSYQYKAFHPLLAIPLFYKAYVFLGELLNTYVVSIVTTL